MYMPFISIPAFVIWICTVLFAGRRRRLLKFFGSLIVDVNRVLTKVVLPTPDSPKRYTVCQGIWHN